MKKTLIFALFLIAMLVGITALTACEGPKTYYNENNEYDKIVFGRGEWSDSNGNGGVYERDGSQLTFFMDDVEVFTGSLKDGTFTKKIAGVPVGIYRTPEAKAALEKEKRKP